MTLVQQHFETGCVHLLSVLDYVTICKKADLHFLFNVNAERYMLVKKCVSGNHSKSTYCFIQTEHSSDKKSEKADKKREVDNEQQTQVINVIDLKIILY